MWTVDSGKTADWSGARGHWRPGHQVWVLRKPDPMNPSTR
jgi:hypothetical protein